VAKYLVVKKVVSEETHHLLVDSELTPEQLKFLVEDCGDDVFQGCDFKPQYDSCDGEQYELRPVEEGSHPDLECWDDFDEDECVTDTLTFFKPTEEG
jgi:hypothetical protein